MALGPSILVRFLADTKELKQATTDAAQSGSTMASGWKKTAGVIAGAVGTAAILKFGKDSFAAAEESAQATARLEQVFSSMGDTTGKAASEAEKYASALSKKIAVDDEAIMAAQAQLATFSAVSDETGRSAGIFDRATAAAADLAAAGFGSLDTNAVQLGKALQDPTKGITALARSGVTFTDAQKEQIKAMQQSGDLLGAQKVVLGAVENQVKGTAAATATSTDKMAVAFGEVQEQVGAKLLPVASKLADLFARYSTVILPVGAALLSVVLAVKAYTLASQAAGVATKVWTGIQAAFNFVMSANPVVLVVLAIVALVAAVILAYQKVDWFRAFVDAAFDAIAAAFRFLLSVAQEVFGWISRNWPLLLAILTGPFGIAVALIVKNWDAIRDGAAAVIEWVKRNWQTLLAIITGPIGVATKLVLDNWNSIKDAASALYNFVRDKITALVDVFRGVVDRVTGFGTSIANAIKGPINAVLRAWNGLEFKVPEVSAGPVHFGGQTIGFPDIPLLARGGIVTAPTLAALAERGPEAVIPLSKLDRLGTTYNITVLVPPTASPYETGKATVDAIRAYEGVAGTAWRAS